MIPFMLCSLCYDILKERSSTSQEAIMVYRQIMNADALSSVIPVPQTFRNKRVEVIIREIPDTVSAPSVDMRNLWRLMDGSITQSLVGIVPNSGKTLDDYRMERLSRHERTD
jgi:hypothetical protein